MKDNVVTGAIVRSDGLTEMETIVAFVTLRVAEARIEPSVAVMVVVPGVKALARPLLAVFATAVLDEVQETCRVTL